MWGTGSPDWGTIPAFLQSGLQALKGGPVCVVNFGESGWVLVLAGYFVFHAIAALFAHLRIRHEQDQTPIQTVWNGSDIAAAVVDFFWIRRWWWLAPMIDIGAAAKLRSYHSRAS